MARNTFDKKNIKTIGRQAYQGLTFGFGDELIDAPTALAVALITGQNPRDVYNEARGISRENLAKDWQEAPGISLGSNIVGGIPLALSKPVQALSAGVRSGNIGRGIYEGTKAGGKLGAITGLGSASSDENESLGSVLWDRARGLLGGAALGSVVGGAAAPLARMGASASDNYGQVANKVAKKVESKAEKFLAKKLAARPDLPHQIARAEAMDQAAKNAGIDLTLAEKLAQSPSEQLLADQKNLGTHPQTQGAMEALYAARSGSKNNPGQIENALLREAEKLAPGVGSYDEAAESVIKKSGQAAKAVTAKLSGKAGPLYDEAFAANQSVSSPLIDKILETPAGKSALGEAAANMQNEMARVAVPDAELRDIANTLSNIGKMKNPQDGVASGLKLKTLDYIKRGFDTAIETAKSKSSPGVKSPEVRRLENLRSAFVEELDNLDVTKNIPAGRDAKGVFTPASEHPEGGAYARARKVYSGQPDQLQMREAVGSIADIDPNDTKKVARALFSGTQKNAETAAQALSAPPVKGYGPQDPRVAVAAKIYDAMDTVRGQPTKMADMIAPDARTRDKIAAYGGSQTLDEALDVINQAKIGDKFRFGSPTSPLQQSDAGMKEAAGAAKDLVTLNKTNLLNRAMSIFKSDPNDPIFYQDLMDLMTTDKGMDFLRSMGQAQGTALQEIQNPSIGKATGQAAIGGYQKLSNAIGYPSIDAIVNAGSINPPRKNSPIFVAPEAEAATGLMPWEQDYGKAAAGDAMPWEQDYH